MGFEKLLAFKASCYNAKDELNERMLNNVGVFFLWTLHNCTICPKTTLESVYQ